jgi:serine/threonine-protein kinase
VKAGRAVKLLDFGIAKHLDPTGPDDPTRTGLRPDDPGVRRARAGRGRRLGVQTDVYALGVLLFELLAGDSRSS